MGEEQYIHVKPFGDVTPQTVHLSTWDQIFARMVTPRLLFFELSPSADKKVIANAVTRGLSKALAEYPELSGRVVDEDPARDTSKIVISDDEGSGVPLKVCDFTDDAEGRYVSWTLYDFVARGYPPSMVDEASVLSEYSFNVQKHPCPVLTAQLSFVRGGAVLFLSYLRRVVDGQGCMPLVRAWAHHTAAAFSDSEVDTAIKPSFSDRRILSVDAGGATPGVTLSDFPELQLLDPNEGFTLTPSSDDKSTPSAPTKITCPIWRLSPSKQKALLSATTLSNIDEAISALVWLTINRARLAAADTNVSGTTVSDLGIGMSLRRRLTNPPFADPNNYTGSATYRVGITSTLADINALSLQEAAGRVRDAFANFNEGKFRGLLRCISEIPNVNALQPTHRLHEGPHLYINLQASFGEYETDWGGGLGKPVASREVFVPIEGYAVVLPKCPDGTLEVMTSLKEGTMECLLEDETFLEFCELGAR